MKRIVNMPIFPLNVVALPAVTVPLHIFEPRYRVLFNTIMSGAEGVDEGLVVKDSEFVAARRFGMCLVDSKGRLASIGTTLEVKQFLPLDDGRLYITSKGVEKFNIKKVVKEKPILICEVEIMAEDNDCSPETTALATEVADLYRNVLRMHIKMNKKQPPGTEAKGGSDETLEELLEPEELTELPPPQLSYWLASVFGEQKYIQQALLETEKTKDRLLEEKNILDQTLKFYAAQSALSSVFTEGGEGATGDKDKPIGPD